MHTCVYYNGIYKNKQDGCGKKYEMKQKMEDSSLEKERECAIICGEIDIGGIKP